MQPFLGANPGHVALFPDFPPPPFACPQAQRGKGGRVPLSSTVGPGGRGLRARGFPAPPRKPFASQKCILCAPGKPSALGPAGLRLWIMIGPRRRRVPIRGIVKRRFPSGKFRGQGGHAHHAMPSMTRGQVVGFIPPLSRHGGLWLVGRASPFLVSQICLRTGILSRTVSAF